MHHILVLCFQFRIFLFSFLIKVIMCELFCSYLIIFFLWLIITVFHYQNYSCIELILLVLNAFTNSICDIFPLLNEEHLWLWYKFCWKVCFNLDAWLQQSYTNCKLLFLVLPSSDFIKNHFLLLSITVIL